MYLSTIVAAATQPWASAGSLMLKLAEGDSPLHDVKPKYDFPFIRTLLTWLANAQGGGLVVLAILFVIAGVAAAAGKFAVHSPVLRNIGLGAMLLFFVLAILVANAPRIIEWAGYQDILDATTSMGAVLVPGLL